MKPTSPTKVVVAGAGGKMGRTLISLALRDKSFRLAGAFERPDSSVLGQDVGFLAGVEPQGTFVVSSLESVIEGTHAVIDFTSPKATLEHAEMCAKYKKGIVIGTTGFSPKEEAHLKKIATKIPIVKAPNMSLGVNLLFKLSFLLAAQLGDDYDVEIVEAHHRHKKDAPSGTALELARQVAEGRKVDLFAYSIYGRKGITGARKKGTIGIHAVRGGDVVGEHTVSFMADGERIELTHKASSREAFGRGALFAAHFLRQKKSGLYSMRQVLAI